ncbi:MAG: hydroxymethylbilane synthase [Ruminococcus sp.]|nr:hydroxymethylbilane synthase [Ruminococcus sp.]
MNIKVGTRKSPLALKQTEIVIDSIKHKFPELNFNIVPISTLGDKILNKPLVEFGGKGVFISEFEELILNGSIDLAVHSAKDMPLRLADNLDIVYVPKRANHKDVLITPKDITYSKDDTFTIGTGSIRRKYQLSKMYPKADFKNIRGNIGTRLDKLKNGEYNAIVLASAGLERLNITEEDFNFRYLTSEECLCAGCQGIITVEGLKNSPIARILSSAEDHTTRMNFHIERGIMKIIGNGCHDCVGVHSNIIGDTIYADILFPNHTRRKFKSHSKEDLFKQIEEYLIY